MVHPAILPDKPILAKNNTDLNISFGLCLGHDIMFNMKSKVPTTTLIVKDREHKHNPYQEFVKKKTDFTCLIIVSADFLSRRSADFVCCKFHF